MLESRILRSFGSSAISLIAALLLTPAASAISTSGPSQAVLGTCVEIRASGCDYYGSPDLGAQGQAYLCGELSGTRAQVVWDQPGDKAIRFFCLDCPPPEEEGEVPPGCTVSASASHQVRVPAPVVSLSGPSTVAVDSPATFTPEVSGCDWSWDPSWNPREFSWSVTDQAGGLHVGDRTFTWDTPGVKTVRVEKFPCSASDSMSVTVGEGEGPGDDGPRFTAVERELGGFYVEGSGFSNRFDVAVDWSGQPGEVRYGVDGVPRGSVDGDATGASFTLDLDRAFPARLEAHTLEIEAVNADGAVGPVAEEEIYVFPVPAWLETARLAGNGDLEHRRRDGYQLTRMDARIPTPPLFEGGRFPLPDWLPLYDWLPLEDLVGFRPTFVELDGSLSGRGDGDFDLYGETGFGILARSVAVDLGGGGDLRLMPPGGFELTGGHVTAALEGSLGMELDIESRRKGLGRWLARIGLYDRVPPWLRKLLKVELVLSPYGIAHFPFHQRADGQLYFPPTTSVVGMKSAPKVTVSDSGLSLWTALDVEYQFRGAPTLWSPGSQGTLSMELEGGAFLEADFLFRVCEASFRVGCQLGPVSFEALSQGVLPQADCYSAGDHEEEEDAVCRPSSAVAPIRRDGGDGALNRFSPRSLPPAAGGAATRTTGHLDLVDNVFPGASPDVTGLAAGPLLLWLRQDPEAPVARSLDLVWSLRRDGAWSAPRAIVEDDRVELAPVAAMDGRGRAVAAWLRIGDPAWSRRLETAADLAAFYSEIEVVSAVFDPDSGTWSEVGARTDDPVRQVHPNLVRLPGGDLLLTWMSLPGGELPAGADHPASLGYAVWDAAAAAWGPSRTLRGGLVGSSSYAAAPHPDGAFVVLEVEEAGGGSRLDLHLYRDGAWGPLRIFAGGGDHRRPLAAAAPGGPGQVVWWTEGGLVHAEVGADGTAIDVRQVRPGPGVAAGLVGARLLTARNGRLVLLSGEAIGGSAPDPVIQTFDGASWGQPRALAKTEGEARQVAGASLPDAPEDLLVAYLHSDLRVLPAEEDGEGGGGPRLERGPSSLRLLGHRLGRNLAVVPDGLRLTPPRPAVGEAAVAELVVENRGDFPAGPFTVALFAGPPEGGGTRVAQVRAGEALASGESLPLSFDLVLPAGGIDLVAVVDPAGEVEEVETVDNRAVATLSNGPPEVTARFVATGGEPSGRFIATADDPDGDPVELLWFFGDGSAPAAGPEVEHSFPRPGTFAVTLLGTDTRGATATEVLEVTVGNLSAACDGNPEVLCLGRDRFQVRASWHDGDGGSGTGRGVALDGGGGDTGYFWFFREENVEVLVKVLDGCAVNGHHWVFAAGLTDLGVTLRVLDTESGLERVYPTAPGAPFPPLQRTSAFPACP